MLRKFKIAFISTFIVAVVSYPVLANTDTAQKTIPILAMFLFDDGNTLAPHAGTGILNDTGITFGVNYPSGNNAGCTGETIFQQDCLNGRDATNNDDSDGHAGFSFTKISADGTELSAATNNWSCVKDNVTGLMWEVKTTDGSIHDSSFHYDWGGVTHEGSNYGTYYSDWDNLVNGSNMGSGLCGYTDWRVPSISELEGLASLNQIDSAIDSAYFPHTYGNFWSASPDAQHNSNAWMFGFETGISKIESRVTSFSVRLVRSGQ